MKIIFYYFLIQVIRERVSLVLINNAIPGERAFFECAQVTGPTMDFCELKTYKPFLAQGEQQENVNKTEKAENLEDGNLIRDYKSLGEVPKLKLLHRPQGMLHAGSGGEEENNVYLTRISRGK